MSRLPYKNIRIIERTETLTGRLLGQLFADQGAEVIVALETQNDSTLDNDYFNRNKRLIELKTFRNLMTQTSSSLMGIEK